jgi:hypothetical protein
MQNTPNTPEPVKLEIKARTIVTRVRDNKRCRVNSLVWVRAFKTDEGTFLIYLCGEMYTVPAESVVIVAW